MSKDTIRLHFEQMTTEELLEIWTANDREEYAGETFEVISEILIERGVPLSPQKEFNGYAEENDNFTFGKFFDFEFLISTSLIKLIYILGMLVTTICSFVVMIAKTSPFKHSPIHLLKY